MATENQQCDGTTELLESVPDGVGGLVLNWHVDSNAAIKPLQEMMAHLALFLPLQVLLQALALQKSVLFMPVLYIIFGMPVDVMLVIGFYSWGMTWSFRSEGA